MITHGTNAPLLKSSSAVLLVSEGQVTEEVRLDVEVNKVGAEVREVPRDALKLEVK